MSELIWLLPILSGLINAASIGFIKLTKINTFILSAGGYFFALPCYIAWLSIIGLPHLEPGFWFTITIVVPLASLAVILMVKAHQISPLMLTVPYYSLTPIFILLTQWLFNLKSASTEGFLAVIITTAGIYLLNVSQIKTKPLEPFHKLAKEKGSILITVVAFIFSITSQLDLIGINQSNTPFYILINHGFIAIISAIAAIVMHFRFGGITAEERQIKKVLPNLVGYGFATGLTTILHVLSFTWIPVVAYVITAKRVGSILFTVALSATLALMKRTKNKHGEEISYLKYRLIGISLMIIGMVIVILNG